MADPIPPVVAEAEAPASTAVRSLGRDAWHDLVRKPTFIISSVLFVFFVTIAIAPGLFTSLSPTDCDLALTRQGPSGSAWFGYDNNGCDVYTQTIYGARASIMVGVLTAIGVLVIGGIAGTIAGFYGRATDTVVSRLGDIFFGIPLLLGALIVLVSFPGNAETPELVTISKVVLALAALGWPQIMRIMRSSVLQVRSADYVQAARALGAGGTRMILKHIVPNSIAPVIVVATIAIGGYIAAEATLSFLGVGLQPPVVSWGLAISRAQDYVRTSPHMLLFPASALSLCVLAFIMLGDAIRDALDPKLR
ncbi:ABC transporter permease [Jiangella alkaliphila]|uniref:Oligopeptide transport system permease protein n=1 Tax=Jiangella alkaliphila TaxID=419479 RepID=A0A1H2JCI5_9ACTN|nr:ABC transporter permease [Jiangella alkaliphila]SDU54082.1 oligopeptide transport system permease protein [Jiangella alkaliphila]